MHCKAVAAECMEKMQEIYDELIVALNARLHADGHAALTHAQWLQVFVPYVQGAGDSPLIVEALRRALDRGRYLEAQDREVVLQAWRWEVIRRADRAEAANAQ